MADWDFCWIVDRFRIASPIWETDSDRVHVLQSLAEHQLRYGPPAKWADYSQFGFEAETLNIRLEDEPLCLGATLNEKYVLEKRIARGGFGVVYLATEIATSEMYAIKLLKGGTYRRPKALGFRMLHSE